MSKNIIHFGKDGEWVQSKDLYVGKDGKWEQVKVKLVGSSGSWIEVIDNEETLTSPLMEINDLEFRGGTPLQGNLILRGYNLSNVAIPTPSDFYYYPLQTNFTEYAENAPNLIKSLNPPLPTLADGGAIHINDEFQQFLRFPTDSEGGPDLRGILGISGEQAGRSQWMLGLQFYPLSMPALGDRTFIIHSGEYGQRISLFFESDGDLVFVWEGPGGVKEELRLPSEVELNRWTGVWIRHKPGTSQILYMRSDRGNEVYTNSPLPYFIPSMPEVDSAIYVGLGVEDGTTTPDPQYFTSSNTHPSITISGLTSLSHSLNDYYSALPGEPMLPNTGSYYIEIQNNDSFDIQFGVAEPGGDLAQPLGVIGWACNTINGRKFNHQYGGGTAWKTAIPANSIIGLLYDSNQGQIEVFVNGVSRGRPFPVGSITVPVVFGISGCSDTSIFKYFDVSVDIDSVSWVYPQAASEFPRSVIVTPGQSVYFNGYVRSLFLRKTDYINDLVQENLINPNFQYDVVWRNINTGVSNIVTDNLLKITNDYVIQTVPELDPGDYEVWIQKGTDRTSSKRFTIHPFSYSVQTLKLDFKESSTPFIRKKLLKAHKQWGGLNGGVIEENIIHDREAGVLKVRACGDLYSGELRGVDRFGNRTTKDTRIGGCVATRDYYGPGSYRVVAKLPSNDGVVSAFWTFHYEEGYPGHKVYDDHISDGIRRTGNLDDGYYTVRNHEIDIEIPTALKTDVDMEVVSYQNARFNTWQGENRNWDVSETDPSYWTEYTDDFVTHGVQTNDGNFHEFRFDWHLGDAPRVEFYIDGILKHTVTTNIPDIPGRFWVGLWFPSSPGNHWAGRTANFDEEWMEVKSISIFPYLTEYPNSRSIGETYPNDVFRSF